jgi:hypothetical protein
VCSLKDHRRGTCPDNGALPAPRVHPQGTGRAVRHHPDHHRDRLPQGPLTPRTRRLHPNTSPVATHNGHRPTRLRNTPKRPTGTSTTAVLILYGSRAGRSGSCPRFPGSHRTSGPAATCSPPRTTTTRWIPDSPPGTKSSLCPLPPDPTTGAATTVGSGVPKSTHGHLQPDNALHGVLLGCPGEKSRLR